MTDAPAQMVVAVAAILTVTGRFGFTVMVMKLLVAGLPVAQVAFEVICTVTTSLLARAVVVNALLFMPALLPFIFHWYAGVAPPLVGVAVKVTEPPEHIVVVDAAMLTLAGRFGFTVMVTVLLVAGLPVAHGATEEVITTVTASALTNVVVVNVLLLVPAFTPFTFHW